MIFVYYRVADSNSYVMPHMGASLQPKMRGKYLVGIFVQMGLERLYSGCLIDFSAWKDEVRPNVASGAKWSVTFSLSSMCHLLRRASDVSDTSLLLWWVTHYEIQMWSSVF